MRSISDFACQLLAEVAAPASDAGSGDVGYSGSSGLVPQHFASNNTPCGYICYGFGQWDGQSSGGYFANNCDGGRSHTYCDYRQQ
mmetsp:Transcript_19822/g.41569  ORF Transcript_19822/g.41569 Transcript_19822/m.41569 type:complete len:85 (+) Transcript_19822:154-408(+)